MQIDQDECVSGATDMAVSPLVSVIIPAYNAEETLEATLESLRQQSFTAWEAIVVDDGSSDGTLRVAERVARRDYRVSAVRQRNGGASSARNTGIERARGVWLLFLDADDVILPDHLQTLVAGIQIDPANGASFTGWQYRTPDGRVTKVGSRHETGDLFAGFARSALFPIHCCLVRRDLVQQVGNFDVSLRTCEDWDLWQRVARTGARFQRCEGSSAVYRMRPLSLSRNAVQMLQDGLRVLATGHGPDPRVPFPNPRHANGFARRATAESQACLTAWNAGVMIVADEDPLSLLELLPPGPVTLTPTYFAEAIFDGAVTGACMSTSDWPLIWAQHEPEIRAFLRALEERSGTPLFEQRTLRDLERRIHAAASSPTTIGASHAARVEVTEPLADVCVPLDVDRLWVEVALDGDRIGALEMPVYGETVPAALLADRIAERFAWPVLGRFLSNTVFPDLTLVNEDDRCRVSRGDVLLLDGPLEDAPDLATTLRDLLGWTVFLQELWGCPTLDSAGFYDPEAGPAAATRVNAEGRDWIAVEAARDVPDILTTHPTQVVLSLAGVALEAATLEPRDGVISAQAIRAAFTTAAGVNLCRACVREALLGGPLGGPPLRERLAAIASQRPPLREMTAADGSRLVAGHVRAVAVDAPVFARLASGGSLTATGSLAQIPAEAVAELLGATVARETIVSAAPVADGWRLPEIIPLPRPASAAAATDSAGAGAGGTGSLSVARAVYRRVVPRRMRRLRHRTHARAWSEPAAGPETPVVEPWAAVVRDTLPVLMYHRVSATGAEAMSRYRVTPDAFDAQLAWLKRAGYRSISLAELAQALETRRPFDGRRVLLTFDDAYVDFATDAWPLLRRYGFGATLFVVSGQAGGTNAWDARMGETLPLLDWDALRALRDEGLEIGVHSASHAPLTGLSSREVAVEAARSRREIADAVGVPMRAFAYPYGDQDEVVEDIVRAQGFTLGFTCRHAMASLTDHPLSLPRIEVEGADTLEDFITKVSPLASGTPPSALT